MSSWPAILFRKLSFLGQIAGVPGPSLQAFSGRRSDTSSCQDVRPTVIGVWVLESGKDHAMGFPWSPKRERLSDSGSGTVRRHWRIKSQLLSAPASDEAPSSTGRPLSQHYWCMEGVPEDPLVKRLCLHSIFLHTAVNLSRSLTHGPSARPVSFKGTRMQATLSQALLQSIT